MHNYIQETAYNLCTEAQRKTLHMAAAHFLESQAHKCKNCGGGDFITGRSSSVRKRKNLNRKAYHGVNRLNKRERVNSAAGQEDGGAEPGAVGMEEWAGRKESDASEGPDKGKMNSLIKVSSSNVMLDMDMEECHCDEVLAKVYPQLVRHWRAAGDLHNTMVYLIEEASAAVATYNNMEALSLLQEANEIKEEIEDNSVTNQELGRLQSLMGQVRV